MSNGGNGAILYVVSGTDIVRFLKQGVGGVSSGTPLMQGKIYLVVVTVSSTLGVTIYINGVQEAVFANTDDLTSVSNLLIGTDNSTYFLGDICLVQVLPYCLSPTQAQDLYVSQMKKVSHV